MATLFILQQRPCTASFNSRGKGGQVLSTIQAPDQGERGWGRRPGHYPLEVTSKQVAGRLRGQDQEQPLHLEAETTTSGSARSWQSAGIPNPPSAFREQHDEPS